MRKLEKCSAVWRRVAWRVARALPTWTDGEDGYGLVLGLLSFGFEECGDYGRGEELGRRALKIEPQDCWARHAVVHVMEMQARQEEGARFMEDSAADWAQIRDSVLWLAAQS